MEEKYEVEKLTQEEIEAFLVGKKRKTVGRPRKRPERDELIMHFMKYDRTSTDVAKIYDVTPSTVRTWVRYYRQQAENKAIARQKEVLA